MRTTPALAAAGLAVVLLASSCSNSSGSSQPTVPASDAGATSPASPTALAGAVDPNAPEVVEPGDIPDDQVFIAFAPADDIYTVKVPEGWARTESGADVTFTDKYNSIALRSSPAASAPTVESVRTDGLADVASDPTFTLADVTAVTRNAGTGVLATYEIGSPSNPVTGKKALLAVERYVVFHNGTAVTMTLSGAKGADNVDPWRIVSDSLAWK